jgi:hypothetical protein
MTGMKHTDTTLRFAADTTHVQSRIALAVEEILAKRGERPRLRVILDGDALPAETIAALINGLRRMRERAGAIEVLPGSNAIRDALLLTGLDQVFAFPIVPHEAERRRPRARNLLRLGAGEWDARLDVSAVPSGE